MKDAFSHYNDATTYFLTRNNQRGLGRAARGIGDVYFFSDRYPEAMQQYQKAMDIFLSLHDSVQQAIVYCQMSDVYVMGRDMVNAMTAARKAKVVLGKSDNKFAQGFVLYSLGTCVSYNPAKTDSAIYYFEECARVFGEAKEYFWKGIALTLLGQMHTIAKEYEKAEIYLNDALKFKKKGAPENVSSLTITLMDLSELYTSRGNPTNGIAYAHEALKLAEEHHLANRKRGALHHLENAYEKTGDYRKALTTSHKYMVMHDSIFDLNANKEISNLREKYEAEKKDQLIQLQNANLETSEARSGLLFMGIVLSLLIAGGFLIGLVFKIKSNKMLSRQKSEIEKQNAERELLLKEIHHRVKNNLQVISSLLSMQSRNMEQGEARDAVREGQGRIKSMSLIHQKLYSEDNLSKINMKEYLEELSDFLFKSYKPGDRVIRNIQAEELLIDVDTAVPLGLIVNELISNALKHAFTPGAEGTLKVSLEKNHHDVVLRISDTGKGLPTGFEHSKSMGMKLVKTLVQQIQGTLHIENAGGTHFLIRFRDLNVV